jgi:integrase
VRASHSGRPAVATFRRVLTVHVLPPEARRDVPDPDDAPAVAWLRKASRPVGDLTDRPTTRHLLDGLTVNLDGSVSAATMINRKRAVVHNLLSFAVDREMLAVNPITGASWRRPKRVEHVDPRVVINPRQARELQRNSDRGPPLVAFFGTIYYSAARPAEVVNLRETDCKLPDRGWGELTLWESRPAAAHRGYRRRAGPATRAAIPMEAAGTEPRGGRRGGGWPRCGRRQW